MNIFTYKAFKERRDKIFISAVISVLSLYFAFSWVYFAASAQSVKNDVVRLHILANSDSKEDQAVKLKVRDALLKTNSDILSGDVTTENAAAYFNDSKDILLKTAENTLIENGMDYGTKVTLKKEYFETREYGDMTFPAGVYTSLKVTLGEGKGHNWWCVMFPPLCVSAAGEFETDEEKAAEYLSESGEKVICGGEKYTVKFKILEIYEELKNYISADA